MIYAIIWFCFIFIIYIGTYLLNKKTPKPKDCDQDMSACYGCRNFACGNRKGENQHD